MSEGRINDAAYAGRPSVCRSCGALIGAGESNCGVCGADASAPASNADNETDERRVVHDPEMVRFMRAIISRPATFTLIILSVNIFVFLILTAAGGSENPQVLIAYGASFKASIDMGEWWRFITPVFMHIGWIHLLVNMYSLFVLGPYVEKLYGSAKFVVFWMVTGAAGVAASYFTSMYQMSDDTFLGHFLFRGGGGPSAGASGALFGLVGVMFVFGIKFRHELPDGFKRAFGTGLLPTILINLFIGYTIPFINNAAHLGGLVAGAVLALFIDYKRPEEGERIALAWRVLQVAVLVLIVASFMSVWRNLKEPTPTLAGAFEHLLTGGAPDSDAYRRAINQGQQAFAATLQGDKDAANPAIKTLDETPGLDPQSDVLRTDLKVMLARARDVFSSEPQRDDAPKTERIAEANQLVEDFKAWQERFRQWVGAEGENYDIQMPDPPKTMPAPSTAPESETRSKETGN